MFIAYYCYYKRRTENRVIKGEGSMGCYLKEFPVKILQKTKK